MIDVRMWRQESGSKRVWAGGEMEMEAWRDKLKQGCPKMFPRVPYY